jgi:hypothetical protein
LNRAIALFPEELRDRKTLRLLSIAFRHRRMAAHWLTLDLTCEEL